MFTITPFTALFTIRFNIHHKAPDNQQQQLNNNGPQAEVMLTERALSAPNTNEAHTYPLLNSI